MKDPNNPCIFCHIRKEELQFENQLAYSSIDSYPVSRFHSLIVPKRHVETYFELTNEEIQACNELILKTKDKSDFITIWKNRYKTEWYSVIDKKVHIIYHLKYHVRIH